MIRRRLAALLDGATPRQCLTFAVAYWTATVALCSWVDRL